MKIRNRLPLLGLAAFTVVLLGCGTAPAAQTAEIETASVASKVASVNTQPAESAPAANVLKSESSPQESTQAKESKPEPEVVEVGYKVGMQVPEFGMSLLEGNRVTSANLLEEGKPVFIYFHATW